jgi:proline racemase
MIKAAAKEQLPVEHPENPEIKGISIAEITAASSRPGVDGRNTVIVSSGTLDWSRPQSWTGVLDRSPCGTGTCARMAVLNAKGQLPLHQDFVHEGILDTTFTGRLIGAKDVGNYRGVIPTITGRAWITGLAQYVVDSEDPFPEGYMVGDIWPN